MDKMTESTLRGEIAQLKKDLATMERSRDHWEADAATRAANERDLKVECDRHRGRLESIATTIAEWRHSETMDADPSERMRKQYRYLQTIAEEISGSDIDRAVKAKDEDARKAPAARSELECVGEAFIGVGRALEPLEDDVRRRVVAACAILCEVVDPSVVLRELE